MGPNIYVLVRAHLVKEEHKTKNKYFKPQWLVVGWMFMGAFATLEDAERERQAFIKECAPAAKEFNETNVKVVEVPFGTRRHI